MTLDREELVGTGMAVLFHMTLAAMLTTTLAGVSPAPKPPAMEVEMVDAEEVGLTAAASQPVTTPPLSRAPEIAEAPPVEVAPPPPIPQPMPQPRVEPAPAPPPTPAPRPVAQPRPTPARPIPAPRVSRLGDDFLKGVPEGPASAKPAAATFSAEARASIDGAIKRQIQPCADDEPFIGAGADRIRLTLNLRLAPSGRLQSLNVVRVAGDDEENARYVPLVEDQAKRVFAKCSPLRLPAELYRTPQGGWSNINMTYRVQ
jgi:outer membrane biosynthesis protein TonB